MHKAERRRILHHNKRGRPPLPNPFEGKFPTEKDKAIQTKVSAPADSTEVRRLVRQARSTARKQDLSACVNIAEEKGKTLLTVWTVERVKRS